MIEPTREDIGRLVVYTPGHIHGEVHHKDAERGMLTGISAMDERTVFVQYFSSPTPKATTKSDLFWL